MKILCVPTISVEGSRTELARRDWPVRHWVELDLLLFGSFDVTMLAHGTIFERLSNCRAIKKSTSIDHLFLEIEKTDLVIACDSGPLHIADAQGKKTIGLFGPTNPDVFSGENTVVLRHSLACSPCHNGISFVGRCDDHICMSSLTPTKVLKTIRRVFEDV